MSRKLLYTVRFEEVSGEEAGGGPSFVLESAYTPSGDYVGNPKDADYLIKERRIAPEIAKEGHSVCSIGFCEKEKKWYGWSHRAIVGFGIGDKIFEEGWSEATDDTPFIDHGPITIEVLEQAKIAAKRFAASVS